ncbi:oleosin Ara h 10.0102-like [Amaranthus tricolor]|uniref:oleosin Ara h 10.0102-like n=1 Tax=Amaranthus tricolor TaxID=29722 RepID=UPI00258DE94E|nr:oleosin Ara h 10.0102-like [Amaranthus tricolor]
MADRDRDRDRTDTRGDPKQVQVHTTTTYPAYVGQKGSWTGSWTGSSYGSGGGPTASQVVALITLVPLSGTLLFLAGLTLVGSIIGLVITTPVFLLFSPVLVPAALLLGLAVTGILSSGAFGLSGLSSLSWVANYLRQAGHTVPDDLDYAKRRVADMAAYAGQKTKDVGQTIESKARESGTHPYGSTHSTTTTGVTARA